MANKKARILVDKEIDGVFYKVNQVIEADSALIKELVREGAVDDSAAAVKYCIDQGANPILHQTPADVAAAADADKLAIQTALDAKQAASAAL